MEWNRLAGTVIPTPAPTPRNQITQANTLSNVYHNIQQLDIVMTLGYRVNTLIVC